MPWPRGLLAPPAPILAWRADGAAMLRTAHDLSAHPARVTDWVDLWADRRPDAPALADRDRDAGAWRPIGYRALRDATRAFAGVLGNAGLGSGAGLVVLGANSIGLAVAILACYRAGVPVLVLSEAAARREGGLARLEPALAAFRAGGSVIDAALADTELGRALGARPARLSLASDAVLDAAARAGPGPADAPCDPDAPAKILLSSGSTGPPKAVVNTHRMMTSNVTALADLWPFLARETLVLTDWLPWSHTFGGNQSLHLALRQGGTLHIDPGRPTPDGMADTLAVLADAPPHILFNVPAGWRVLVDALVADAVLAERVLSRLRLAFYAGAPLTPPTQTRLRALLDRAPGGTVPLVTGWGMTETAPMATTLHFKAPHANAIGLPGPGTVLKLVPAGEGFEARIKGPGVTPGYLGDARANAALFDEEGFLRSGDLVDFADRARPETGLVYLGRGSENFKLATGGWVTVGRVRAEALAALGEGVRDLVVVGEGAEELGLLLLPVPGARPDGAAARAALETYNAGRPGASRRIGRFGWLDPAPDAAAGEVNEKGTLNQRLLRRNRVEAVAALYTDPARLGGGVL